MLTKAQEQDRKRIEDFLNAEAGHIYYKLGFTQSGSWGSLEKEGGQ